MMKNLVPRALCAVALTVGVVGGPVGAQAQVDPHPVATVSKVPTITVQAYAFTVPKKVFAGERVKAVNLDDVFHTVTSVDGKSFSIGVPRSGDAVFFRAPTAPGQYPFYCIVHSTMRGVLIVKDRRP